MKSNQTGKVDFNQALQLVTTKNSKTKNAEQIFEELFSEYVMAGMEGKEERQEEIYRLIINNDSIKYESRFVVKNIHFPRVVSEVDALDLKAGEILYKMKKNGVTQEDANILMKKIKHFGEFEEWCDLKKIVN